MYFNCFPVFLWLCSSSKDGVPGGLCPPAPPSPCPSFSGQHLPFVAQVALQCPKKSLFHNTSSNFWRPASVSYWVLEKTVIFCEQAAGLHLSVCSAWENKVPMSAPLHCDILCGWGWGSVWGCEPSLALHGGLCACCMGSLVCSSIPASLPHCSSQWAPSLKTWEHQPWVRNPKHPR